MNCNDIESLLYDYVNEQLGNSDRDSMDLHLKSCEMCNGKLRMMEETLPLIDNWTAAGSGIFVQAACEARQRLPVLFVYASFYFTSLIFSELFLSLSHANAKNAAHSHL
jgi:hypothetical protein